MFLWDILRIISLQFSAEQINDLDFKGIQWKITKKIIKLFSSASAMVVSVLSTEGRCGLVYV